MSKTIFIIAGEISSDNLGSSLMDACNNIFKVKKWIGIGGPQMKNKGLISEENFKDLSIIGISKIIFNIVKLSKLIDRLIDNVLYEKPDIIFTVDTKIFSLLFAMRLKKRIKKLGIKDIPIIQFVAPTIWAWGNWRKHFFEKSFDGLLCLFPFEPNLFNSKMIKSVFVGHPSSWNLKSRKIQLKKKLIF